jgi:hypothetical protein
MYPVPEAPDFRATCVLQQTYHHTRLSRLALVLYIPQHRHMYSAAKMEAGKALLN